jgi:hypothetical protein
MKEPQHNRFLLSTLRLDPRSSRPTVREWKPVAAGHLDGATPVADRERRRRNTVQAEARGRRFEPRQQVVVRAGPTRTFRMVGQRQMSDEVPLHLSWQLAPRRDEREENAVTTPTRSMGVYRSGFPGQLPVPIIPPRTSSLGPTGDLLIAERHESGLGLLPPRQLFRQLISGWNAGTPKYGTEWRPEPLAAQALRRRCAVGVQGKPAAILVGCVSGYERAGKAQCRFNQGRTVSPGRAVAPLSGQTALSCGTGG